MPLLVRNLMSGPTVVALRDSDPLILESAGDVNGGDVQRCADSAADDVNFLKALDAGMIEIESAPETVRASLAKQAAAHAERRQQAAQVAEASLDRAAQNDMVMVECVGPSPSGRGQCGTPVPVRERSLGDKAPLCSSHEQLRSQYVQMEDVDAPLNDEGKSRKVWKRAGMAASQAG